MISVARAARRTSGDIVDASSRAVREPAREDLLALLNLRVPGERDLDGDRLLPLFGEQRRRFAEVLRGFGPDEWAAPTRCREWSAQDVVRHMCDATALIPSSGDRTLDLAAGFDPRITPRQWLSMSADE